MSKNRVEREGPQMTSQYGAYALRAGFARLHALIRMHSRGYLHARTRAHTDQQVKLIAFRERVLVSRYTYIACLI